MSTFMTLSFLKRDRAMDQNWFYRVPSFSCASGYMQQCSVSFWVLEHSLSNTLCSVACCHGNLSSKVCVDILLIETPTVQLSYG